MRERYHYHTTRKAMLTLLYFSLNNRTVTEEDLCTVLQNESMHLPKQRTLEKINKMVDMGFIHYVKDEIKLTLRGLFLIDKKERTIENIMYGHVLRGPMDRSQFKETYIDLLMRITHQGMDEDIYMKPLRALKKRELIDFTKTRVWGGGKQIKLRKEMK